MMRPDSAFVKYTLPDPNHAGAAPRTHAWGGEPRRAKHATARISWRRCCHAHQRAMKTVKHTKTTTVIHAAKIIEFGRWIGFGLRKLPGGFELRLGWLGYAVTTEKHHFSGSDNSPRGD